MQRRQRKLLMRAMTVFLLLTLESQVLASSLQTRQVVECSQTSAQCSKMFIALVVCKPQELQNSADMFPRWKV